MLASFFPLFVLIALYASLNVRASSGLLIPNFGGTGGIDFSATGNFSQTTIRTLNESSAQNLPNFSLLPAIPQSLLIIFVLILFAAGALAVIWNARLRIVMFTEGFAETLTGPQKEKLADLLDRTISQLRSGGDYRTIVLECYRKLTELLEVKSKLDGSALTPREFGALVSTRLKFDSPYLDQITSIFENARYSPHEISRAEADSAIDCLSHLSSILREQLES